MSKKIKMVLYAEPGVGKSTFASKSDNPFFITTDGNYSWLDLPDEDHVQISSWEEAKKVFVELNTEKYAKYNTIVVDLIEDLFKWVEYEYCKRNKVNHVSDIGYAKGYDETRNEFYIEICKLIALDKHIIFLTHGLTKIEKDRRGVELTKYIPSTRIPDKVWDLVEGRVRYFLRAFIKGEEQPDGRMIKHRYLSIVPKENEYGIARGLDESSCPEDIDLDWNTFCSTIGIDAKQPVKRTRKTKEEKIEEASVETKVEVKTEPTKAEPVVDLVVSGDKLVEQETVEEKPSVVAEVVEQPKVEVKEEPKVEVVTPTETVKKDMTREERVAALKAKLAARGIK